MVGKKHLMGQLNKRQNSQRGDTLIEVTIAMAVLGLILAATTTVINRSLLSVSNAVERTSIRGSVNSQIEMLRYVFDTQNGKNRNVAKSIINNTADSGSVGDIAGRGCSMKTNKGFYLSITNDGSAPIVRKAYSHHQDNVANDKNLFVPTAGQGIWIEGSKHRAPASADGLPGYIDFYVRACWTPRAANATGQGRLESVVRVYYREDL